MGSTTYTIKKAAFLQEFQCLTDKCEDTCCKGWGMQLDAEHKALYEKKAPELLDAVTSGEAELIMRRDPETDFCVKFDNGLCGIHRDYGTDFLGDACHFYPRITRTFGELTTMTATLSCPAVAELVLFGEDPFAVVEEEEERIPATIKDYLEEGLDAETCEAVTQALIAMAGDEGITPERAVARLFTITQSLETVPKETWVEGIAMLIKFADGRLQPPEDHFADGHRLINILVGLLVATRKSNRPRLEETITAMETALNMTVDRESLQIINHTGEDFSAYDALKARWEEKAAAQAAPILRRWVQAQLSMGSFPFAGFGRTMMERAIVLGVRFATIKLALMAHMEEDGTLPDEKTIIRVIQSLSRFLDHLADPEFSMMAYEEAGWTREPHLRGLIGDK